MSSKTLVRPHHINNSIQKFNTVLKRDFGLDNTLGGKDACSRRGQEAKLIQSAPKHDFDVTTIITLFRGNELFKGA